MNSLQGHLLVAVPHQLDPNFVETVILVVAHTNRGAMGVILNRPKPPRRQPLFQRRQAAATARNLASISAGR